MLIAALALLFQSGTLPEIRVESTGNGGYLFIVDTFAVSDGNAVNDRLDMLARQKCGRLAPRWGKYSMTRVPAGTDGVRVDSFTGYRQAIQCIDPATDPYKPAPADWAATPNDERDATDFAERYLKATDHGDTAAVRAMLTPSLSEATPAEELSSNTAKFRSTADQRSREVTGVKWWVNPDFAPFPGVYVAVGFRGPQHCGYLLLHRVGPGNYAVSRQEVFGKPLSYKLTTEDRASLDRICAQL